MGRCPDRPSIHHPDLGQATAGRRALRQRGGRGAPEAFFLPLQIADLICYPTLYIILAGFPPLQSPSLCLALSRLAALSQPHPPIARLSWTTKA